MKNHQEVTRVAIACQGGGSHTAFTAGVLKTLLRENGQGYKIQGLSGTSGGAICAVLAWYGLIKNDNKLGERLLSSFWSELAARDLADAILNTTVVWSSRLSDVLPWPKINPNHFPNTGQQKLRQMLLECIPFDEVPSLVKQNPDCPLLLISAVDVKDGKFVVFAEGGCHPEDLERTGKYDRVIRKLTPETILASGTIPNLFPPMIIEDRAYWDGLFSRNPPLRDLPGPQTDIREIWLIQINPTKCSDVPRSLERIDDRRNELIGNLSLEQELYFIDKINEFVESTEINQPKPGHALKNYRHIELNTILLDLDLDASSKYDRSPDFLERLMAHGERRAKKFLSDRKGVPATEPVLPKRTEAAMPEGKIAA